jgi:hypothetical protein
MFEAWIVEILIHVQIKHFVGLFSYINILLQAADLFICIIDNFFTFNM